jgi:glucokinase
MTDRLLADIGGTHARFALAAPGGGPRDAETLHTRDHEDVVAAARSYLREREVAVAVFAVNGPVEDDLIQPTNTPWPAFSIRAVTSRLGLDRLVVINDFVAQALAVPALGEGERRKLGGGEPAADRPIGVLGPGTGLGVAALLPTANGWQPLPSEGGHVSFAPHDEVEAAVLARLRERFGHISSERLLAGPGLVNLASALAELGGATLGVMEPRDVVERARDGTCPHCRAAIERYPRILGAAAGDVALMFLARGGVFIAGGMVGYLGDLFDAGRFREGFVAKGRFDRFLEPIPTWLVTRGDTGLLGASALII